MNDPILITGSAGLIGSALTDHLAIRGDRVIPFDLRTTDSDVRDAEAISHVMEGCRGVVHLAAVSRVVWAQQDPVGCNATNVRGTANVIEAALASLSRPWVIFASSREVYGQPARCPVVETAPLCPMNVYGRAKLAGEHIVQEGRASGLRAAIVRLSNVYGSVDDHPDRVVPAFVRAALAGRPLRVDGPNHAFDFTHVEDVAGGIAALIDLLDRRQALPRPTHFVTGYPQTLGALAKLVVRLTQSPSKVVEAPPRTFDVSRFWGDPSRARALLGWSPRTVEEGLVDTIAEFRREPSQGITREACAG